MSKEIDIEIYTDGGCNPNPGEGGWGVVILQNNKQILQLCGYEKESTNNKMELTAVIEALKFINNNIKKAKQNIIIYTDSQYVKNGITKWIKNWKFNGWKTSNRKSVKNKELWEILDCYRQVHNVKFKWVKAHNGNEYNEIADKLATDAILYKKNEEKNQTIILDDKNEIILDNVSLYEKYLIETFKTKSNTLKMSVQEPMFSNITKKEDIQGLLIDLQDIFKRLQFCNDIKIFNNKNGEKKCQ